MPNLEIIKRIKQSVQRSIPLTITTYKLSHETELQVEEIIGIYLDELGQGELKNHLSYCIKELGVNAKKANTKRVYFEEKKLDLNNREDYNKGMSTFKEETLENLNYWLDLQEKKGLYIKFFFHPKGRDFKIAIRNNAEITRKEQMRIYDRIARARAFQSLEEAFAEVLDDSEGAGLGIVVMVLMLQKMGLSEDAYDIEGENGITTASIAIPINEIKLEKVDMLIEQIVQEIDQLPQFPENIVAIQHLINDPKSEINDIARKISVDPALTADLLKTVNSAQFMLVKKVDTIVNAVKMLGLRGVKNMLFSYGTEKILDMPTRTELWSHAHRVAFYSFTLARQITRSKDILDDTYLGGILHDIGKIIFSSAHPKLLEKIQAFSTSKEISPALFEDLSAGYNHAEIGAKVAEKWNFSAPLIDAIRFHHDPKSCRKENRSIVYCIYLGNSLCGYETKKITYDVLDHSILRKFHITSEKELKEVVLRLSHNYASELESA